MKRLLWSVLFGSLLVLPAMGWTESGPMESPGKMTLKAGVSYSESSEELPAEMYGTWQRTRTLIESNFSTQFESFETGYWTISKDNDQLTLTNPDNGATTTIHVQSITGSTAQFEYQSHLADGTPCREQLTLTAHEDSLKGVQTKTCSSGRGKPLQVTARVSGFRLDQGPALWQ